MVPFKFVGYCDESEDDTTIVITCAFARAADWALIVGPWQKLLNEYEIPEFHAEHCEHRKGYWKTWMDPAERLTAATRFLDLIVLNRLPFPTVYATGVDLKSFRDFAAPAIQTARPGARLAEPWLLAFHQVLNDMLYAQRFANNTLRTRESLDLICDEKNEFSARVGRRVKELKKSSDDPLANVTFADSESAVGLQMADLVAYEMRKALTTITLNDETAEFGTKWKQLMDSEMPSGQRCIYATFWDEAALRRGNLPRGLV